MFISNQVLVRKPACFVTHCPLPAFKLQMWGTHTKHSNSARLCSSQTLYLTLLWTTYEKCIGKPHFFNLLFKKGTDTMKFFNNSLIKWLSSGVRTDIHGGSFEWKRRKETGFNWQLQQREQRYQTPVVDKETPSWKLYVSVNLSVCVCMVWLIRWMNEKQKDAPRLFNFSPVMLQHVMISAQRGITANVPEKPCRS